MKTNAAKMVLVLFACALSRLNLPSAQQISPEFVALTARSCYASEATIRRMLKELRPRHLLPACGLSHRLKLLPEQALALSEKDEAFAAVADLLGKKGTTVAERIAATPVDKLLELETFPPSLPLVSLEALLEQIGKPQIEPMPRLMETNYDTFIYALTPEEAGFFLHGATLLEHPFTLNPTRVPLHPFP